MKFDDLLVYCTLTVDQTLQRIEIFIQGVAYYHGSNSPALVWNL